MKILVVEDDRVSRTLLREILDADRSHELTEAADGEEAWSLLEKGPVPDLCILDIILPGLDGLEILKRIRADARLRDMKVILCTARNDRTTVTQAAALSVNYFIVKPYASRTVLEQVQKVRDRLDGSRRLESRTAVCDRLGIDSSTYVKLLRLLVEEVEVVARDVASAAAEGEAKTSLVRLNALKGAGMNLGASQLVGVLSSLELELSADVATGGWTQEQQARIIELLGGLKVENDHLAHEVER